jgi:hypothetical protein
VYRKQLQWKLCDESGIVPEIGLYLVARGMRLVRCGHSEGRGREGLVGVGWTGEDQQDCHFWLEDDAGRVYDIVPKYITNIVAPVHGALLDTSHLLCGAVVNGLDKARLRTMGFVYLPAADDVQKEILEHRLNRLRFVRL